MLDLALAMAGALVMLSPILCGVGFGTRCVTGLLAGGIASGVQMAVSASNTGGAWDNAKKYISKGSMDDIIAKEEPETCAKRESLQRRESPSPILAFAAPRESLF